MQLKDGFLPIRMGVGRASYGLTRLPHGACQATANHKDTQLEEGNNQTTPANKIRVGGPEIGKLLVTSHTLGVDRCITSSCAIRIAAARRGDGGAVIKVAIPAAASEL